MLTVRVAAARDAQGRFLADLAVRELESQQQRLADLGYRVRVYVPFGAAWYPYFMRRLAERPANVWFVLRSMFAS